MSIINEILTRLVALEKRFNNTDSQIETEDATAVTGWTDDGTVVRLTTSTDNVSIGQDAAGAKLQITGDTDEEQLIVKANATQTNAIAKIEAVGDSNRLGMFQVFNPDTTPGKYTSMYIGKSVSPGGSGEFGFYSDIVTTANAFLYMLHYGDNQDTQSIALRQGGKVGMGTGAPAVKLHINYGNTPSVAAETIRLEVIGNLGVDRGPSMNFYAPANSGTSALSAAIAGVSSAIGTGQLIFKTVSSSTLAEQMRLTSGGDLGVGTSAPSAKIHVKGAADNQQLIVQANATQTVNLVEVQDSAGTALINVTSDGKLAVNSSLTAQLSVQTSATNLTPFIVKGVSGQTASYFVVQDYLGNSVLNTNSSGYTTYQSFGALTSSRPDILVVGHRTTATPVSGFGGGIKLYATSNGFASRPQAVIDARWVDEIDATRKARISFSVYDTSARDGMKIESDGANAITAIGGGDVAANTTLTVESRGAGYTPIVAKANATQTANTLEVQDSSGEIGIAASPDTKDLRLYDVGASNYVGFNAPPLTANQIWTLPDADGQPGNLLSTDGAGNLGWAGTPIVLSAYDAEPSRASETNLHGGILSLATGQALNSGSPINVTKGIGKLLIVINAGSDVTGSITVTGESIDRETGASTPGDTNSITVDALSTDGSTTDGNGNTVHTYTGAYITSDWFTGSVALSTTNLTLTDVDVYHVSFEQFNDAPSITLNTFDANIYTTNVNAEFDAYLYDLQVTGSKANVTNTSSLHVGTDGETAIANKYWRLRRGNINVPLVCTTDGIWIDVFYSNAPAYVEDVNIKLWATQK